jgi:hypothetical protein
LKKIRDLKDQIDLDKKAKQDIESYYRNTLDEKEKLIALLKVSQITENQPQSPTKLEKEEPVFNVKTESLEELKDKNKRLELLLVKSKEFVKAQKEQLNALNNEKENTKKVNENEILMKLDEERNRFESECKTAELKINELNLMIAESRDSQVKLNTEFNQKDIFYQDQIKMMKIEFDEKQANFENETKKSNEIIESLKQNKNKFKDLEDQIEKLKEEKEVYLKSTRETQDAKITNLEAELNHLKQLNENLTFEKSKLNDDFSTKETELIKLNETILKLEKEIQSKEESLIQANDQIKTIKLEAENNLNEIIKPLNENYFNLKSLINHKLNNTEENCDIGLLIDNFKNNLENKIQELNEEMEKKQHEVNIEKNNYKRLLDEFREFKETDFINLKNNFEIECENLKRKNEKILIDYKV